MPVAGPKQGSRSYRRNWIRSSRRSPISGRVATALWLRDEGDAHRRQPLRLNRLMKVWRSHALVVAARCQPRSVRLWANGCEGTGPTGGRPRAARRSDKRLLAVIDSPLDIRTRNRSPVPMRRCRGAGLVVDRLVPSSQGRSHAIGSNHIDRIAGDFWSILS